MGCAARTEGRGPDHEDETWYRTYDSGNRTGTDRVNADRGKFDNHVCVPTGDGVGVGVRLHKQHD
ncbi:hypothetical protein B4N89_33855 [Embleya scabrispora]|uniref:Uncharacterized protein n=1 Tax=Embleya scabrispora TaxID=159449 RepID=A0A1T3NQQ4_9ACTN|nr:hypothetical protein [Embleya scabrispora]OPC79084.1 hypothetical protein B4N89_33855 [Embleya scabrispora]